MRLSATLLALATIGCSQAASPLPQVEAEGRRISISGLANVTLPSEPAAETGIEAPSRVWRGDGWEVRYGLVSAYAREPVSGQFDKRDCAAISFGGGLETVTYKSTDTRTFETGDAGQLYVQLLADNAEDCKVLVEGFEAQA